MSSYFYCGGQTSPLTVSILMRPMMACASAASSAGDRSSVCNANRLTSPALSLALNGGFAGRITSFLRKWLTYCASSAAISLLPAARLGRSSVLINAINAQTATSIKMSAQLDFCNKNNGDGARAVVSARIEATSNRHHDMPAITLTPCEVKSRHEKAR